jgi:UDP-N-acetyl-D-mannosaminuronic acid dehydrogenase
MGMRVCVVGLGWMGLPVALIFANSGKAEVAGLDIDGNLVREINSGKAKQQRVKKIRDMLKTALGKGTFRATTDVREAIKDADLLAVVVPLVVNDDKTLDYGPLENAVRAIAENMKEGALVVIETTVPVGTTRKRFKPILDKPGKKYYLAYYPIRAMANSALEDMEWKYPRLLGAVDDESLRIAEKMLKPFMKNEIIKMGLEEAEATKLFEVVYRDVNIALANELALVCEEKGLDYKRIKEAANTCFYYHLHDAGIGVGGHCLPVYPYLLLNETRADRGLIRNAREVNEYMPGHTAELVKKFKPRTVTIFGIAYLKGTSEYRFSPAIELTKKLEKYDVKVCDPYIDDATLKQWGQPVSVEEGLKSDVLLFTVNHPEFEGIENRIPKKAVVVDGRCMLDSTNVKGEYLAIGKG